MWPTDAQLEELSEQEAPRDGEVDIHKLVLPMSVDTFYKTFIADGAAYGIDAYNIEMGEQDVSVTEWVAGETAG